MKIAVVGVGYAGLVTGTCLAETGNFIVGIDKDPRKIDLLNSSKLPIYEPGLLELVLRNVKEQRLSFTTDMAAVADAELVFLAVGTPPKPSGEPDLTFLWKAAQDILRHCIGPKIIAIKSTVPVGTNRALAKLFADSGKPEVDIVSNPEFLKEGAAVDDFMKPDRVVVGVRRADLGDTLRELYLPFLRTERPFLVMSPESAEMTKYVANAMLATKISFINEMANLSECVGADINDVRRGIGHDARIGFQFLFPGVGYGGSCFPKDIQALIHLGKSFGLPMRLTDSVEEVNKAQKEVLAAKIRKHYGPALKGKNLALWGLAFKPQTDDIREAPSLSLINALLAEGVAVRAYDPEARANASAVFGDHVKFHDRPYDALAGADGLAVVTEWQEFRRPDFARMRSLMREPVIFDGRNVYAPAAVRKHGFTYYSIGRT
ncbi:MAG: UDP-glucose/GDP-mannose dehydrogenase family protein [Planctomycetes bacterium]|nr:UDP-glucose/GDP-mannose dehydrogenase family protein [Planctomycetota bacterium]